jgi:lysophospholipid acyltransferase (LPLAT)-like uncharacterized protein
MDRHLIPLPGAHVAVVLDEPLAIARDEPAADARLAVLAEKVHAANRQARQLLDQPVAGVAQAA